MTDCMIQYDIFICDVIVERFGAKMDSIKNLKDKFDLKKIIDFVKKYARYFVAGTLFVVLLIVLIFFTGNKTVEEGSGVESTAVTEQSEISEETIIQAVIAEELQENANVSVNELIQNYYNAYAAGDIATLQTLATPISEKEQSYITMYSQYIESYQNIVLYTKSGLDANSYLVNVYVEIKFVDVDTPAPGLDFFYVRTNEEGSLYIDNLYSQFNSNNNENALDTSVQNLITQYVNSEDVVNLLNDVQAKFDVAYSSDENLATLVNSTIPDAITAWAQSFAPAATETPETETPSTEEPVVEEPVADTPEEEEPEVTTETVVTTDKVNVRATASTDSERLGSVERGTSLTRTGTDGEWSIVEYNGGTGYIKSEYLTTDTASETTEGTAATNGIPEGTVITLESTTNIRSAMSETADRVGVAYPGEKVTVVMSYAEGWTKVTWDGETGYIKTDLLQ